MTRVNHIVNIPVDMSGLNTGSFGQNDLFGSIWNTGAMGGTVRFDVNMPTFNTPQTSFFGLNFGNFAFDFSKINMPSFFNFGTNGAMNGYTGINFGSLLNGNQPINPVATTPSNKNFKTIQNTNVSQGVRAAIMNAMSEVGVREITGNNDGYSIDKYRNGVSDKTPWCASFVSWCYGQGQGTNNNKTFGYDKSSLSIRNKAIQAGHYAKKDSGYIPQVGDLMVWDKQNNGQGHIGIIAEVSPDGKTYSVIEGNCGNAVKKVTRTIDTAMLDGFVKMNEWLAS